MGKLHSEITLLSNNEEDVCAEGIWQNDFTDQPERLTEGDKKDIVLCFTGMRLFHH